MVPRSTLTGSCLATKSFSVREGFLHGRCFALVSLSICLSLILLIGCSRSASEPKQPEAPYAASGGVPVDQDGIASNSALQRIADATAAPAGQSKTGQPPTPTRVNSSLGPTADVPRAAIPGQDETMNPAPRAAPSSSEVGGARRPAMPSGDPAIGRTQLKPDLDPQQLVEFLGVADRDMQGIWSRLPQVTGGRDELIRIAKMKLEASRRLKDHPAASVEAKSAGARGELQALSHLASFSDLKSAEELEQLATENLKSNDPALASDSRLVLIGFALEALQNGEDGAADRIITYIDQIATVGKSNDVPTLMVMGQAREALAAYGNDEAADHVRRAIVGLYADSPNPDLAMAAAELAGSAIYDKLDRMLSAALNEQPVRREQWIAATDELISESPDLRTVEYLAGAALQLEAAGKDELVQATFDAMARGFDDPVSDAGREVKIAMAAMEARQNILGVRFNPVLPAVGGSELSMDQFAGQVVLVPFWAAAFPESLQLIGRLKQIESANPEDVAIVGVNLDGDDRLLQAFLDQNDLGFPSFRSKSSAEAEVANPLAAQFGVASMPFLAILDRKGNVAAINFTDRGIEEKVNELLSKDP
jgi:hypothetical protein